MSGQKQIWLIWIVWIGVAIFNPFFLNMLFGLSILLTLYQVMAYEDNNGINYLISFLPVKRSEYVISRYLLGIGSLLLSIIVIYIVHLVSTQINPLKEVPIKILLPISITSAILAMSVIIPLVLKFGINKGRVFMSIIIMVIAMAPISIISYISKNPKMIDNIMNIINNIGLPIIAILINIVMILISICISIKLYQNKEIKE